MDDIMNLAKYSIGVGDRFGVEGAAQLRALQRAASEGVRVVPVWNKSNREHSIIGTRPEDTRRAADAAVKACGWTDPYYLDADHIGLATVDEYVEPCDFFTIDVADFIGKPVNGPAAQAFVGSMERFKGLLNIRGMRGPVRVTGELLTAVAQKYLAAISEAGKVYRRIAERKGSGNFVTEISLDEADRPQSPAELFFILAAVAREKIPVQTIAPKFTGEFLKGIDYVGDPATFNGEFRDDLAVIAHAVAAFGLPSSLKLSVHTGSDKFTLYPLIRQAVEDFDAGLHVKTAGTTWLEEMIGLAASDGEALQLAKDIYTDAFTRYEELCRPYVPVIRIDRTRLPAPREVGAWDARQFVETLRHDPTCPRYNIHFRQFVHVSFRVAAEMDGRWTHMLQACRAVIEQNVTMNIYDRHVKPLFAGLR